MKSTFSQLASRGFIAHGSEQYYQQLSFSGRINLLLSNVPTDRTLGARLLSGSIDLSAINYLLEALKAEKKLYTKIEICDSLVSFGNEAVKPLISLLGSVGNNQHKHADTFKKYNYPLPRDIAARTLIRIGTEALPDLLEVLDSNDFARMSEAIDAIGYICFYNYQPGVFQCIETCFYRNSANDLIKWKIVRAMSAFVESEFFLKEQQLKLHNKNIYMEMARSLKLLQVRTDTDN